MQRTHRPSASASRARREQRRRRPALESLEGRQLLSLTSGTFQVNSTQGYVDNGSANASSPSGLRVVVWTHFYSTTQSDIYAQMYNPNGSARTVQIAVDINGAEQTHPRVAMDSNGDFVVVWQEDYSHLTGNTQDSIIAKTFNSLGNPLTSRFEIADGPDGTATNDAPDVGMAANGNFAVEWQQETLGGGGIAPTSTIRISEYDLYGDFLRSPSVAPSVDFLSSPSVSMNAQGNLDLAYQDNSANGNDTIHLALYDTFGDLLKDQALYFSDTANIGAATSPRVSMDNNNNALVAFQAITAGGIDAGIYNTWDIEVDRVEESVLETGIVFATETGITFINDPGYPSTNPDVALDHSGSGLYVVAYDTQLLGAPRGDRSVQVNELSINSGNAFFVWNFPALPSNAEPAVSLNGTGGYMMTFTREGGANNTDVDGAFGQLPIAPAAKDLKLTPTVQVGHLATLTGSLTDAAGNKNLTLTVNWGDGSKPQQSKPGLKPFAVTHKYTAPGTYKLLVTWSDNHGRSNSRDLFVTVK
jgi:hypothetical protein